MEHVTEGLPSELPTKQEDECVHRSCQRPVRNVLMEDTVVTCTGRLKALASELGPGMCQAEEGGNILGRV